MPESDDKNNINVRDGKGAENINESAATDTMSPSLLRNPSHLFKKPSFTNFSSSSLFSPGLMSPASKKPLLQQHCDFWTAAGLDEIDASIQEDATNLIRFLPDIQALLEKACLERTEKCTQMWSVLKPLLESLQEPGHSTTTECPSPKCAQRPVTLENVHGEVTQDDYVWLKNREDPEVTDYIQAENDYTLAKMEFSKPLQKLLYTEFVSRLDEEQESAHVTFSNGWSYFSRKVSGQEYATHCRVDEGISFTDICRYRGSVFGRK